MVQQKNKQNKSKKWFIASLIIWLAALPVTVIVQMILRFLLSGSADGSADIVQAFINIFSILLGIYGLLGWIPVIILLVIWQSKK